MFASLDDFYKKKTGYSALMATRPQTLGYGLVDSPAGLLHFSMTRSPIGRIAAATPSGNCTAEALIAFVTSKKR
jgi:hypothetical protein